MEFLHSFNVHKKQYYFTPPPRFCSICIFSTFHFHNPHNGLPISLVISNKFLASLVFCIFSFWYYWFLFFSFIISLLHRFNFKKASILERRLNGGREADVSWPPHMHSVAKNSRACPRGSVPVETTPSPTTFSAFPCFMVLLVTVCWLHSNFYKGALVI